MIIKAGNEGKCGNTEKVDKVVDNRRHKWTGDVIRLIK